VYVHQNTCKYTYIYICIYKALVSLVCCEIPVYVYYECKYGYIYVYVDVYVYVLCIKYLSIYVEDIFKKICNKWECDMDCVWVHIRCIYPCKYMYNTYEHIYEYEYPYDTYEHMYEYEYLWIYLYIYVYMSMKIHIWYVWTYNWSALGKLMFERWAEVLTFFERIPTMTCVQNSWQKLKYQKTSFDTSSFPRVLKRRRLTHLCPPNTLLESLGLDSKCKAFTSKTLTSVRRVFI